LIFYYDSEKEENPQKRFGGWLLAIGYWLLAVGGWLLAVGYWLLAVGYWLLAFSKIIQVNFVYYQTRQKLNANSQ